MRFEIDRHMKDFPKHCTELIIHESGEVEYAIPSHTKKLEEIAMKELNLHRYEDLVKLYIDDDNYMDWLLDITKCVSVWYLFCKYKSINRKQISILRSFKLKGIYKGKLPKLNEEEGN